MAEPLWTSDEIIAATGGRLSGAPFAATGNETSWCPAAIPAASTAEALEIKPPATLIA